MCAYARSICYIDTHRTQHEPAVACRTLVPMHSLCIVRHNRGTHGPDAAAIQMKASKQLLTISYAALRLLASRPIVATDLT